MRGAMARKRSLAFCTRPDVHVAEHAAGIWAFRAGWLEHEVAHNRSDDT